MLTHITNLPNDHILVSISGPNWQGTIAGKSLSSGGQEQETTVPVSQAVVICGFGELGQTVSVPGMLLLILCLAHAVISFPFQQRFH